MSTLRLIIYIVGTILAAIGIAMFPFHFAAALAILCSAICILTLLGWANVVYAMKVGIIAADPTENIPEGEETA